MKKYKIEFTFLQAVMFAILYGVGNAFGKFLYERIFG